jgi:hypothetical protein
MKNISKNIDPFERIWDLDECIGAAVFGIPTALCSYSAGVITVEIIHTIVSLIQDV